jgi:hypothetical protein
MPCGVLKKHSAAVAEAILPAPVSPPLPATDLRTIKYSKKPIVVAEQEHFLFSYNYIIARICNKNNQLP